jgi:signal peptidase I
MVAILFSRKQGEKMALRRKQVQPSQGKTSSSNSGARAPDAKHAQPPKGILTHLREWLDALVIAYILAMFIRTFVVELFRIPTGSMSPTLIGDVVAMYDYDDDGDDDLVLSKGPNMIHVFYKEGDHYIRDEFIISPPLDKMYHLERKFKKRHDMIAVCKFAYWFSPPHIGDIVVFKVPKIIWDPIRPIYIKRAVGRPGDRIAIQNGSLYVNGEKVTSPEPFKYIRYQQECEGRLFRPTTVPPDEVYVFGDNTKNSRDSRVWGGVPLENLKGKAFFRYWPITQIRFLR